MPDYYSLGQKHAQQYLGMRPHQGRSHAKDFLAGVDPTGTLTSEYGVADVGTDANQKTRRAVGTAGGVVGGAVALPLAIAGALNMKKGLPQGLRGVVRAFGEGAVDPLKKLQGAVKMRRVLRDSPTRGVSEADMQALKEFAELKSPPGVGGALLGKLAPKSLSARQVNMIPSKLREAGQQKLDSTMKNMGIAAGLGGGAQGLSSYMQYNKGKSMGEKMDAPTRARITS